RTLHDAMGLIRVNTSPPHGANVTALAKCARLMPVVDCGVAFGEDQGRWSVRGTCRTGARSDLGKGDGVVNEPQRLRFAVGVFGGWPDVEACVGELTAAGMLQSAFNLLGLRRVLAPVAERASDGLLLRELPFPGNKELMAGTSGPVAERLAMRLAADGDTL